MYYDFVTCPSNLLRYEQRPSFGGLEVWGKVNKSVCGHSSVFEVSVLPI